METMLVGKDSLVFDTNGRRLPFDGMRVFGEVAGNYYQLKQPKLDLDAVFKRITEHNPLGAVIALEQFKVASQELLNGLEANPDLAGLLNGVHVPFFCPQHLNESDLGEEFEKDFLPAVSSSFLEAFPGYHYKTTVQGELPLRGNLAVAAGSRYEKFLAARRHGVVVGWYFPTALQEYDIASQRAQMATLPWPDSLVLSGTFDTALALVGSPDLLVNADTYPPVLCLSALEHTDRRLMTCFKAYGQSLEFWCMSQMLTPTITQVSEQWAGGLTCFTVVK
jgi:hypothetical protein